jgi:hypothetical protein
MIPVHNEEPQIRFEQSNDSKNTHAPEVQRTVYFKETVSIRKTVHINDYSDAEVEACWYSGNEFYEMKREVRYTVDLIDRGSILDERTYSKRGLENRIRNDAQMRAKRKTTARGAVIREQLMQKRWGENNGYSIAKKYRERTYHGKQVAYLRGVADAATVALNKSRCRRRKQSV